MTSTGGAAQRRSLLVTGGAGFIGLHFVSHWRRRHPEDLVVVLDALTYAGNAAGIRKHLGSPSFEFVHGDICDTELVLRTLRKHRIDTVVHLAAESHVDRSIAAPSAFTRTNVEGTLSLLTAASEYWLNEKQLDARSRFYHISTDEVFGSLGPDDPPFTEESRYQPNSPYAASKAASDHLVRAWHKTYGLPVVGSNCSNNFGPYQYPEKLIPLMLINALHGQELPIYGDGSNVRDWLHVIDHCRAMEAVLESGRTGCFYNIGGGNEWKNLDLVRLLCELLDERLGSSAELRERFPACPASSGSKSAELIRFVLDRPGHDSRYAIDGSLIEKELSFKPRTDFRRALEETVEWYLQNEDWWRSIMDGSYREWVSTQYGGRL